MKFENESTVLELRTEPNAEIKLIELSSKFDTFLATLSSLIYLNLFKFMLIEGEMSLRNLPVPPLRNTKVTRVFLEGSFP